MRPALSPAQTLRLKRDGFLVLRGAVPAPLVAAAARAIEKGLVQDPPGPSARQGSFLSYHVRAPEVLGLLDKTRLRAVVDQLLGEGRAEPCTQAQVALRYPAPDAERRARAAGRPPAHIDGLCGLPKAPRERYTLCAGVALTDAPRADMGNFMAYPGTHARIARLFKRRGPEALRDGPAKALRLPAPVQARLRAGDAVLFHFQTAHDAAPNLSARRRDMAYFRVYHADAWRDPSEDYLMRALTDPWLEWPGLRGARG